MNGAQSVIMVGLILMHKLFASKWAKALFVSIIIILSLYIFCHSAGYQGGVFYSNAYYGKGTGSIFLDNVQCTGTEDRLIDCSHSSIGSSSCDHGDDVSVFCFIESKCISMVKGNFA